jgi:hypothetical protein
MYMNEGAVRADQNVLADVGSYSVLNVVCTIRDFLQSSSFFIVMLGVIMLSIIMVSAIMLSIIMLVPLC